MTSKQIAFPHQVIEYLEEVSNNEVLNEFTGNKKWLE